MKSGGVVSEDLIKILAEHCRDSSLMVRKLMVGSLTELVKAYPEDEMVVRHWVDGVFPLILDVEAKAAERVHECVWEQLFGNIVSYADARLNRHFLPWKILKYSERLKMTKYLSRACSAWVKDGQLKAPVYNVIKSHVNTENGNAAWLLFSLVTPHLPLSDPHFVMDYFNTSIHTPEGVGLYTLLQVLRVLFSSVIRLSREEQKLLQKDLVLLISRFAIPPELISTAVDIATVVSSIESGQENNAGRQHQSNIDGWAVDIIERIDGELTDKILKPTGDVMEVCCQLLPIN